MTKLKFLLLLNERLSHLPSKEVEERLAFYSEMIEDRMEEGLSEEEAVSEVGSIDDIAAQIIAEVAPRNDGTKEEEKPKAEEVQKKTELPKRRMKAWEITLLVLGSPLWISLLAAAVAVIISLYVSIWSVIISLWAIFASFVGTAVGATVAGTCFVVLGNTLSGVAMIGAGLALAGLAIFSLFGCKAATKGAAVFTKNTVL